jgi:hypothetical protein
MKGKGNVKRRLKKGCEAENCKRDLREGVSHGGRTMHFTIFVIILDILQISMWP